jgi:hypothetical protein
MGQCVNAWRTKSYLGEWIESSHRRGNAIVRSYQRRTDRYASTHHNHVWLMINGFRRTLKENSRDTIKKGLNRSLNTHPNYALLVVFENCKFPIEHQSEPPVLIGKQDKCLHHEQPVLHS